jgi:hypothetical protein
MGRYNFVGIKLIWLADNVRTKWYRFQHFRVTERIGEMKNEV